MIPYILAAVGGYLLGQSRKETYADGGVVSNMSNKEKGKVFSFLDDYNRSDEVYNWWESFGYTKDEAKDIEHYWALSRGHKMADGGIVSEKFKELTSDGYNFLGNFYEKYKLKVPEYEDWQVVAIEDNIKLIASKSQKVFFRRFFPNGGMMADGGKVKSKKWIQDALSGGKNKGALRRTAAKKGLLRGDENLSKTDLKKLQKMGGTTAKRAHLAETLRKFDEGGGVNNRDFMTTQDLKSVNADFFESNLNFDNAMKKYAALPYGGLYVYNGKDWQIIPRTSEISHERDAKKFLFAQIKNEEKFSRALDELEKSHP